MKILTVDDSVMIRKLVKNATSILGHDVLEAANGEEALKVLEAESGDLALILLDWNMPIMDGFTTLQKIKSDDRFKEIPVMMVTTEAERANVVKAIQAGASNYLSKPFTQQDLTTKIMECLGMGF